MTVYVNVLQLFVWLDEIDEIGLNALVWDSKCVLTLWETSKTKKKKTLITAWFKNRLTMGLSMSLSS